MTDSFFFSIKCSKNMNSVFLSVEPVKTVLLIGKKGNNQLSVFGQCYQLIFSFWCKKLITMYSHHVTYICPSWQHCIGKAIIKCFWCLSESDHPFTKICFNKNSILFYLFFFDLITHTWVEEPNNRIIVVIPISSSPLRIKV